MGETLCDRSFKRRRYNYAHRNGSSGTDNESYLNGPPENDNPKNTKATDIHVERVRL